MFLKSIRGLEFDGQALFGLLGPGRGTLLMLKIGKFKMKNSSVCLSYERFELFGHNVKKMYCIIGGRIRFSDSPLQTQTRS